MLFRTLSLAAAFALTACGGGGSSSSPATQFQFQRQLQTSAHAAVGSGLAGIALGHLTTADTAQARAGLRQVGATAAIQAGDAFMIGSTTKAMTSALAGRLVERGAIAWTTTLAEALPDLAAGMQPAYRTVTLEQLLSHRGGLLAFDNPADQERFQAVLQAHDGELPTTLASRTRFFAAWLLAQDAPVRPGQDFLYSNAGYAMAALMLEARTGRPVAELFDQELAQPLGLQLTWTAADTRFADRPAGHGGAKGKLTVMAPENAEDAPWFDMLRAAGCGTTMSPDSFATWVRWHLRALRGETTPLASGYLQRLKALKAGDYALGWIATDIDGRAVLAHDGEWRGFTSLLVIDAQGRSASFAFTNTAADDAGWVMAVLNQSVLDVERALPPK